MAVADLVVEADIGSATTRGRHPDHHWLVRLRRGQRAVVIGHGLTRGQADRLVARLAELVNDEPPPAPQLSLTDARGEDSPKDTNIHHCCHHP